MSSTIHQGFGSLGFALCGAKSKGYKYQISINIKISRYNLLFLIIFKNFSCIKILEVRLSEEVIRKYTHICPTAFF